MNNVSLHWPSQVLFLVGPAKDVRDYPEAKAIPLLPLAQHRDAGRTPTEAGEKREHYY